MGWPLAVAAVLLTCCSMPIAAVDVLRLSDSDWRAMSAADTHRQPDSVVDAPVPFHLLPSVLEHSLNAHAMCAFVNAPPPCHLVAFFSPSDDLHHVALTFWLARALQSSSDGAQRVFDELLRISMAARRQDRRGQPRRPSVAPAFNLSRAEYAEALRFAAPLEPSTPSSSGVSDAAAVAALKRGVLDTLQQLKRAVRDAAVVFGSNNHLRLQHARIGFEVGVPFVHLAYDAMGLMDFHARGEWESVQTMLLQSLLRPGDVAADIGSHVGSHTVALARAVGARGVVHSFEVTSPLRDVQRANLALAGLSNVLLHRVAVGGPGVEGVRHDGIGRVEGDRNPGAPGGNGSGHIGLSIPVLDVTGPRQRAGEAGGTDTHSTVDTFGSGGGWARRVFVAQHFREPVIANFGAFSIADERGGGMPAVNDATEVVELVTVDSFGWYLSRRSCPQLVKVDAEGMEIVILQGAQATLDECRPVLHLESNRNAAFQEQLLQLLFAHNYTLYWDFTLFGHVPQTTYLGDDTVPVTGGFIGYNVLAVPAGLLASLPDDAQHLISMMTPVQSSKLLPQMYDDEGGIAMSFLAPPDVVVSHMHGSSDVLLRAVTDELVHQWMVGASVV